MEQFLNLFWLAIVLVTTFAWGKSWARQRRGRYHSSPLQEMARLGCALLLLFFTISMTDDLNTQIVLVESGDQRHSVVLTSPDQPSSAGTSIRASLVAILPARLALESCHPWHDLSLVVEKYPSSVEEPLIPDRSPPASRL